jgi:hypothetical protein
MSAIDDTTRDKKRLDYMLDLVQSGVATHPNTTGLEYSSVIDEESKLKYGQDKSLVGSATVPVGICTLPENLNLEPHTR